MPSVAGSTLSQEPQQRLHGQDFVPVLQGLSSLHFSSGASTMTWAWSFCGVPAHASAALRRRAA